MVSKANSSIRANVIHEDEEADDNRTQAWGGQTVGSIGWQESGQLSAHEIEGQDCQAKENLIQQNHLAKKMLSQLKNDRHSIINNGDIHNQR